jgi:hypothetical protein
MGERPDHAQRVIDAVDRILATASPGADDDGTPPSVEQQARNWEDTAARFSRDADYWRERCHAAEARVAELDPASVPGVVCEEEGT